MVQRSRKSSTALIFLMTLRERYGDGYVSDTTNYKCEPEWPFARPVFKTHFSWEDERRICTRLNTRAPLKTYCAPRLLRWVALEILTYLQCTLRFLFAIRLALRSLMTLFRGAHK
jgi:hypothetical protein